LYWLGIYAAIAAVIFAAAGLVILICFVWCELKLRLWPDATSPIGIPVAVSNALAKGGSENE